MGKGQGHNACGQHPWTLLPDDSLEPLRDGVRALGLPAVWEVGGCVRDSLLGRPAQDLDVLTCGLSGAELLELASRHGRAAPLEVAGQLVGVRLYAEWCAPEGVEIALARSERSTGPGHRDFQIAPLDVPTHLAGRPLTERHGDPQLQEQALHDLRRRDFTCNAIARDLHSGTLLDPLGGVADLQAGLLRATGPDCFRDDPLRVLRLLARVARDGLQVERQTEQLARRWAPGVRLDGPGALSGERVGDELDKILGGRTSAAALTLLADWELAPGVLPEWAPTVGFQQESRYHALPVHRHILQALRQADADNLDLTVKWAVLLHDIAKPQTAKRGADGRLHYYQAKPQDPLWQHDPQRARAHEDLGGELAAQLLQRLRRPQAQVQAVRQLVERHMFSEEREFSDRALAAQQRLARRMLARYGPERCEQLLALRRCDLAGKHEQAPPAGWDTDVQLLGLRLREQARHPYRREQLSVDGRALQALGLPAGPAVGAVLEELLRIVIDDPTLNDPQRLRPIAERAVARQLRAQAKRE